MQQQRIKILLSFILLIGLYSIKAENSPKLMVFLKIDGLQQEHIQQLHKELTVGGFRKIMKESLRVEELKNPILSNQSSDIATLLTGTYPAYNGITGKKYFDKNNNRKFSILANKNQRGLKQYSAHNLKVTTITDQLKLKNRFSKIHSIAINPENAILLGGHNATSVTWVDIKRKKWTTSTHYKNGLSRWAKLMNWHNKCQLLINKRWTPLLTISHYDYPTLNGSKKIPFSYATNEQNLLYPQQSALENTPNGNELVFQLAQMIVQNEPLGMDNHCDALMLHFSLMPFNVTNFTLHSAEQEDMYLRLDEQIQQLVYQIENKVGKENVLFVFIGNKRTDNTIQKLKQNHISAGYFNSDKAMALLNSYLMILYGQEQWINAYSHQHIYLNHKAIKKKNIKLADIKQESIAFLNDFEGIADAYPQETILNHNAPVYDIPTILKLSTTRQQIGDIILSLKSGWKTTNNKKEQQSYPNPFQSFYSLYLMGYNIKPSTIQKEYFTIDIAPTLSKILNTSYPNGCIGKKIPYQTK